MKVQCGVKDSAESLPSILSLPAYFEFALNFFPLTFIKFRLSAARNALLPPTSK